MAARCIAIQSAAICKPTDTNNVVASWPRRFGVGAFVHQQLNVLRPDVKLACQRE